MLETSDDPVAPSTAGCADPAGVIMSVCSASASLLPQVCPGFIPCDPNAITTGDNVTIEVCVENTSEQPTSGNNPPVEAVMLASSSIEGARVLGAKAWHNEP